MNDVAKFPEKNSHFQVGNKDDQIVCGCGHCDYYLFTDDELELSAICGGSDSSLDIAMLINETLKPKCYQCKKCKKLTLDTRIDLPVQDPAQ